MAGATDESSGSQPITETKKAVVNPNPRVEIDTSPPFESVKEAVDRFGGSGPWIPHHLLRLAAGQHHETEVFDVEKIEEQAVQLERDLIMKEQETLNVLKELEAAKKYVEGLKINLMQSELSSLVASPGPKSESHMPAIPRETSTEGLSLCPVLSPGLMFMELNQAKLSLSKTSIDLAEIQASVESLNKKMRRDKLLLERAGTKMQITNSGGGLDHCCISQKKPEVVDHQIDGLDISMISISRELKQVNFEAEQFKKMTEASRYEVIKAMTEIERTKNSIKMAEMRLNAAKKMEEAAKAVEAIALAESKALSNSDNPTDVILNKPGRITLSFEEYRALTQKAQQAEDLCKTKFVDTSNVDESHHQFEVPILEKFEEKTQTREVNMFNEDPKHPRANPVVVEEGYSRTHGPVELPRNNSSTYKFIRNHHPGHRNPPHILSGNMKSYATKETSRRGIRSADSIGDILSRKLILQDDVVVGRHVENHSQRQHVSLSQMLQEQSRLILHSPKSAAQGNVEKQYSVLRRKFGFIQMPIPTKESKKKVQPLNLR